MADDVLTADDPTVEVVRRCAISKEQRRTICSEYRQWYERGTNSGPRAASNKLRSHLDRVASFLWAPDAVRFGVHLPVAQRNLWIAPAEMARDEFRERWRDSGADLVVMSLIEWALVNGSTIAKVQKDDDTGFSVGYIQPWDFGVIREGVPSLDRQDALCHWYSLSISEIERWLYNQPRETELLAIAKEHQSMPRGGTPRSGLVISSVQGLWPNSSVEGGFPGDPNSLADVIEPNEDEPVVTFVDCWERKRYKRRDPVHPRREPEVFEDWRVTTLIDGANVMFAQRRNPDLPWVRMATDHALPAQHPFVAMVPRPLPDYLWGRSELSDLRQLQEYRWLQLSEMQRNVMRQLDPAKFFSGVPDWEEANRAMSTAGGGFGSAEPNAKMQELKMTMGNEVFETLKLWDQEFAEQSGVPESLSEPGTVPGGVRSTGQFGQVSDIAVGRIKRMAMVVEDPVGAIATKAFKILQRHETETYTTKDGKVFLLSQLPAGLSLRVDAHSAAPVFRMQTQNTALILSKLGAIGAPDVVELMDPPNRDELKAKAEKISENKAQFAQEKLRIEEEKAIKGKVRKT